jgi:tetratricopeptide (TPR) repeat protein
MSFSFRRIVVENVVPVLLFCHFLAAASPAGWAAQAGPSPDPAPLVIILMRLERGDAAGAERLMRDNLPVTKGRLEAVLPEIDRKFDEAGRFGATAGHDIHTEVMNNLLEEIRRNLKLFEVYSRLSGDDTLYKRLEARRLRVEGAYYTHDGEDACGDTLDWAEAQRLYRLALERLEAGFALAKETNDLRVMASAKNNMGSTLIRLLEPDQAIQEYQEARRYADQVTGEMYKGMVDLNTGNTFVWIGEPEQSLSYSQAALASFQKMGRVTWQANAVMNIGNAQMQKKEFGSAWETIRLALDLAKQSGEDRVRGRALLNLGVLGMQLKQPEAAGYVQEAMEWYKGAGGEVYTPLEREVVAQEGLRLLSQIAKQTGDAAAAARYNQQFMDAVAADPDRYGALRASPCYALYKARPMKTQASVSQ